MRKGFDALCGIIHEQSPGAVLRGGVYIFANRKRNQIKLLTWDGDGLAIYYKRLEKGVYELPSINAEVDITAYSLPLISEQSLPAFRCKVCQLEYLGLNLFQSNVYQ